MNVTLELRCELYRRRTDNGGRLTVDYLETDGRGRYAVRRIGEATIRAMGFPGRDEADWGAAEDGVAIDQAIDWARAEAGEGNYDVRRRGRSATIRWTTDALVTAEEAADWLYRHASDAATGLLYTRGQCEAIVSGRVPGEGRRSPSPALVAWVPA